MKLDVQTLDGKKAGAVDLDPAIFGIAEIRTDILQRMVKYQLAKRRAGTHKTLSRGEVSRSHSKLYKQKGTGQARHGAANAPIFRGGGHAHNRLPRDYGHALSKTFRALALRHALSAKAGANEIIILASLTAKEAKTKAVKAQLAKLGIENALFIGGKDLDLNFALAARAIPNVDVLPNQGLNVYDMLRRKHLVLTTEAFEAIKERFKDYKPSRRERAEASADKPAAKKRAPAKKAAEEGAAA